MTYHVGVKPGKSSSVLGMFVGGVLVLFGVVVAIPLAGFFGIIWTIVALAITVFHAYNAFSARGVSAYEVNIDSQDRTTQFDVDLRKLAKLRDDGLLTSAEFERKRAELMRR
jgi:hypothetical protein